MFQTNMINSVIRRTDSLQPKTISLNAGQIFNGKILKLYPGQLATLQLGGVTLTAKLEAALKAEKRYWFVVKQGDVLPILQVLEDTPKGEMFQGKNSENILKQLGLNNTKLNEMILRYFAKDAIPFNRSHIVSGAETLQNVGMENEEGLAILKLLLERNLPITLTTFSAMQSVLAGHGLANQLKELSALLEPIQEKNQVIKQTYQLLQATLMEAKVDHHHLLDAVKTFLMADRKTSQQSQAQGELQKLGVIQEQTPGQLILQMKKAVITASESQLKQIFPTLSKEQLLLAFNKDQIGEVLAKIVIEKGEAGLQTIRRFFSLFFSTEISNDHLKSPNMESTFATQIVSIINKLGYHYDRDVFRHFLQQNKNDETLLIQLKGLLLKAQQLQTQTNIQKKIDLILSRITGQQLLSVNQENLTGNYALLIPLKLMGETSDLTIQWQGKRENNNGKLNPDHCRVVFYLHLNKLKETIIDVQIQNRIISLRVINEQEKPKELLEILQPYLKKALNELNYQLSSIKWIHFKEDENNQTGRGFSKANKFYQSQTQYQQYQGVDIRI